MSLRKRIKKSLMERNISLFLFQKKVVILTSLLAGFVVVFVCFFMSGTAIFHKKDFLLAVICSLLCYVIFVFFHITRSPYFDRNENGCDKGSNEIQADVILSSSDEICSWRLQNTVNWIGFFLAHEGACYQKCTFGMFNDFEEKDYFWYILTKRRAEILTQLYLGEIKYWDYGFYPQRINFFAGVPLRVVYDRKNHFLKQLLPVDEYQYTPLELELIRKFNKSDSLGKKDINSRALITYWGILFVLMPLSFVISLLAVFLLKFFIGVFLNFGEFLSFLPVGVLFFLILYLFDRNRPLSSKKYRADVDSHDYVSENVILTSSYIPQNTVNPIGLFRYVFREEHVNCYELNYIAIKRKSALRNNQVEKIYYILTNEKSSLLSTLSDINVNFSMYVMCESLEFKNCVPLKVTYGKQSRVLKSIAPVEGYEYTETQLAAIEKFNTLYP